MSIRTSFNPMGTLGRELPYLQPIMTSATTWSNEPSFGCVVSADREPYSGTGAVWQAMDGSTSTSYQCIDGGELNYLIDFMGRELSLEKITLSIVGYYISQISSLIVSDENGTELWQGHAYWDNVATIQPPKKVKKINIYMRQHTIAGNRMGFSNIKIKGSYKG